MKAATAVGFTTDLLLQFKFQVYLVSYSPFLQKKYLVREQLKGYTLIRNQNALIISTNTPPNGILLVGGVIYNDSTMLEKKNDHTAILIKAPEYMREQYRGSTYHACTGSMYMYGYRSDRKLASSFGKYAGLKVVQFHLFIFI